MECTKIRHETAEGAEKHRAQLHAKHLRRGPSRPGHLGVYLCPDCGGYHVGHSKRRKRKEIP
jgi:hypothetical protein